MDNDKSPSWNTFGDDEPDLKEDKPIKSRPDFFSAYLTSKLSQIEQQKAVETEEDDDEEDESDGTKLKKKRKFTGLLKEVFPSIVASEKPEQVKPAEGLEIVSTDIKENPPEVTAQDYQDETKPNLESEINNVENVLLGTDNYTNNETEKKVSEENNDNSPVEFTDQERVEIEHSFFEEAASSENAKPVSHTTEQATAPSPIPLPMAPRKQGYSEMPNFGPQVFNEQNVPLPQEVIIEKRPTGAVLAFLGAEFLSRRRDKKLKKELNKQKKSTKASIRDLEINQMSQKQAQENLLLHQQQQGEKLVSLQTEAFRSEKTPSRYLKKLNTNRLSYIERTYKDRVHNIQNNKSEATAPEVKTVIESTERWNYPSDMRHPNNAYDKIRHEIPGIYREGYMSNPETVYSVLEKKHEAMLSSRPGRGNRVRPNTYMAANPQESNLAQPKIHENVKFALKRPKNNITATLSIYHQSVIYGVGSALVILVLMLISYLLR